MTSIRDRSAESGLRSPRRGTGATTSSSASPMTGICSLSGSLNKASCGLLGSTVCSDLRPNKRSRNNLVYSLVNNMRFVSLTHFLLASERIEER